ncbi:Zinc finger protein [Takifugu flavidus]|uniref:Zinc finger protein n=1 Tax=Takifugu flavidus TaxID=433684 RepID=A0A5C6N6J6_9TELE|nr:Zinc finger protein [Takifugu flavidus]
MAFQKGDHHNLGFNFSSHKRNVDWRRINVLNIDLLVRTVDIDALQEYISDVTYCSLETVRCPRCMSPADPTLVKLFRLAQLSLEWLHHCQEKLISGLQNTEDKLKSSEEECQKLKDKNKEQEEKMKGMVSELKSRRTIIKKQQSLFATNINNGIQCGHCEKNYLNAFFLQKHMLRRHPDQCQNLMVKIDQKNSEIESLKLEINSLRMQLAQAAKEQQDKLELHYEKEKLKLEKSAMQVEAENLRLKAENLRLQHEKLEEQTKSRRLQQELQNEKEERQQQVMMFQAEILNLEEEKVEFQNGKEELQEETTILRAMVLRLQEEKVELQNGKEELQQQTTMLQAEILRLQQEKVEFQNGKEELQQQTTMLQAEILKLQQEKVEFQNGKDELQQQNTMLQAEILKLQHEKVEFQNGKDEIQQQNTMLQAQILRLQEEKVEFQNIKEELRQETTMFQAEILKQQQEKVESQNVKEEFRQETTMLQAQILKLQQENLTLESENSTLKDVNEKQDHRVQKKNRREQNKSRKQTGKVSMPTPTQSSTIFVDDSSSDETSSEQEETKIRKCQLQKQECDTFQRPSEDMRKLSHRPQLPSQSERNELQTDKKLTGNKKEKPEMPARSQFRLPSKVIQVKPAAPVSKLLEQPAELDKTPRAKPKYPSVSTSSSGEESETGGDTSEQEEDKRKLSRRPQLPRQSERNELQTDKKLTGNKKEKPEMPARSQFRLPSKDIQVKPVAPVSKLLEQPAELDKMSTAKPKYPSVSTSSSGEESETGGDTSEQEEDKRKLPRRPQLPRQSERNELQTDKKLTGNKKEKPEMPARSQFRLPSKDIQVKPVAPVSKLLEQPAELDKMSTAKPKYPSVSTSSSGEESETGGDTSEQEEVKRKLSRCPQLPSQSERNELETDKKLTGNKKEKPEMPGRSQLRLPSKDIQVKPVAPVSELLDQPAEPDKTPRAKPKYPSYSIISSDEESETGGDTSQQQEVMRIWSIRPWLPSDSGGSEQETENKLDVNKKGEPGKVSDVNSAETIVEAQKPKTQQKRMKSHQNISIKRSATSSQPAASQLEQKTTVNKYPWFRPKK